MSLNKRYTKEEISVRFKSAWNALYEIALKYNSTKLLDPECSHYLRHYSDMFNNLRSEKIKLIEIGVKDGDSLRIWREYFDKSSQIFGIELNKDLLVDFKQENTKIFFGDQCDVIFLSDVLKNTGPVDVIIDDGGHTQEQLRTSFEFLFKYALKDGGLYIMEDLGCSYWYKWSGGINNVNSIIFYLKQKIDSLNYRFWKGNRIDYIPKPIYGDVDAEYFDENIVSITFIKGMCIIKKGDNSNWEE